jgi:hypothetical protein
MRVILSAPARGLRNFFLLALAAALLGVALGKVVKP